MKTLYNTLQSITPHVPRPIRDMVRNHIPLVEYDLQRRKALNPYEGMVGEEFKGSSVRLGILQEVEQAHKHYIAACKEMKQSYRVVDLLADDWIEQIRASECDAFLVWPSSCTTIVKALYDSRLRILVKDLRQIIFPSWEECWLTENKPRLRDWMIAHNTPHPRTWVAYRQSDAMNIVDLVHFPVVGKSATGACGTGVRILKSKREVCRYIKQVFGKGIIFRRFDPHDRQRGYMFLQEYLPNTQEWRMVRVGDSYFGYRKEKGVNGLHSASHAWSWLDPGPELLSLLKHVTDTGHFTSMDVDIFKTEDGRLLVNECQTTFGCSTPAEQMKIDGVEGRYLFDNGQWRFEPGEYCRNHMCNLRVQYLLSKLIASKSAPS